MLDRIRSRIETTLRRVALASSRCARRVASVLARWGGKVKRIEIVVRNPGFEGTQSALGSHIIDFEDDKTFDREQAALSAKLRAPGAELTIILTNEKGDARGFNPEYYVSHSAGDKDAWMAPPWLLPAAGAEAPERED